MAKGLNVLPTHKTYQLWVIEGKNAPVSVGTFLTDKNGIVHADFRGLAAQQNSFNTFAVTAEPQGGMPFPTGPMHLLGKF